MAYYVLPVLTKNHQLKTVRVIEERDVRLVFHRDGTAELALPDDQRLSVDAEAVGRHDDLREAIRAAREMLAPVEVASS